MVDFSRQIPAGDNRERDVCNDCGFIAYENPKIVAGAIVSHKGQILLCKRAIEPRVGFWTMPAGYIELQESPRDGAIREAREEALANIKVDAMLGMFTVPHLSQVQVIYRATLPDGKFGVGEETQDARLF
ncbi:MAG: NUDIX domain-containing protein, partial [Alphaproteobacteria bacterium]